MKNALKTAKCEHETDKRHEFDDFNSVELFTEDRISASQLSVKETINQHDQSVS